MHFSPLNFYGRAGEWNNSLVSAGSGCNVQAKARATRLARLLAFRASSLARCQRSGFRRAFGRVGIRVASRRRRPETAGVPASIDVPQTNCNILDSRGLPCTRALPSLRGLPRGRSCKNVNEIVTGAFVSLKRAENTRETRRDRIPAGSPPDFAAVSKKKKKERKKEAEEACFSRALVIQRTIALQRPLSLLHPRVR